MDLGVALATVPGRDLARAAVGTPHRDPTMLRETRPQGIPAHAFRALGVAWAVAGGGIRDRPD
jgi:hypothetical protein